MYPVTWSKYVPMELALKPGLLGVLLNIYPTVSNWRLFSAKITVSLSISRTAGRIKGFNSHVSAVEHL